MAKIHCGCPNCNQTIRADDSLLGRSVRCPHCKQVIKVLNIQCVDANQQDVDEALITHADFRSALKFDQTSNLSSNPTSEPSLGRTNELGKIPQAIGRYRVVRELGRGAFGIVYLGEDPVLMRSVAIKVMIKSSDSTDLANILPEARAVAKLRHPNIVAVFEANSNSAKPFVVSEFIEGETLASKIGAMRIAHEEAVRMLRDLALGLDYAHSQGLIHRDIKPHNILVDASGRAQITDFGLAIERNVNSESPTEAVKSSGTLAYMAPEQLGMGAVTVGPEVDQYALGVSMFEILAGERPYQGTALEILDKLERRESRALRDIDKKIPVDLSAICAKAMAHDPWQRYENCRELAKDLDRFLAGELIRGRRIGVIERTNHYFRKHPRIIPWAAVVGIAVLSATIVPTFAAIKNHYTILSMQKSSDDSDAQHTAAIQGLQADLTRSKTQLEQLKKDLEANARSLGENDEAASKARELALKLEAELRTKIIELEMEIVRLSSLPVDPSAYLKEIEQLKKDLAALETNLANLPKLEQELKDAKGKVKSLEDRNSALAGDLISQHNSLRHFYLHPVRDQAKSIEHANAMCELDPTNQYMMAIASSWQDSDLPARDNLLTVANTLPQYPALVASCLIQASVLSKSIDDKNDLLKKVTNMNGKNIEKHKKIAESYLKMNREINSARQKARAQSNANQE